MRQVLGVSRSVQVSGSLAAFAAPVISDLPAPHHSGASLLLSTATHCPVGPRFLICELGAKLAPPTSKGM